MTKDVLAPMSGKIIKINFGSGEEVKEKDVIFLMDAMKMEIEILSPSDGTIGSIKTEVGSTVLQNAILATIIA